MLNVVNQALTSNGHRSSAQIDDSDMAVYSAFCSVETFWSQI
jgi:hypothetical protein